MDPTCLHFAPVVNRADCGSPNKESKESCNKTSQVCLMHRCVCVFDGTYYKITTTNYISKTSLYTTFRMYSSRPWPLKILTFALLVTREIATYN
jgi:hypothetical protein